jgi:tetratricopeptide (TPR) repeat protein
LWLCVLRRLIELLPDDPSGYSNRSYAFRKLGDYEAAVEDYTTALALTGTGSTRLHNNRCELCTRGSSWRGGSAAGWQRSSTPRTAQPFTSLQVLHHEWQRSHLHMRVPHLV